jgi:hypothetical protein
VLSLPEPAEGEQLISHIGRIASRQFAAALDAATERRIAIIARNELPRFIRPCLTIIVTAARGQRFNIISLFNIRTIVVAEMVHV